MPAAWAGDERGYLERIALRIGEEAGHEPSVRTARSGEVTVTSEVIDHLGSDGWASLALSAGFHAVLSVPLTYEGVQYGVLSVYAQQSGAFDGRLPAVLDDLGDTIAYAINATQRKQALLTDAVTELEFEIRDRGCPILALARSAECPIELRDVLSRPSEGVLALVTVPASALDGLIAAVEDSAVVETARPVAETDGRWLVQLTASGSLIAEELADHGARLEALAADQESVRIRVDAPSSYPQAVVEMIRNAYPSAELIARRHDREPGSGRDDAMRFWERLTDRQREVAQMAYYGGYFDRPRAHTGEELAERLDVSSQAFHKHLRHIQQTLFETTIEDGPGERV
jgi:predicted DNA binding protein